MIIAILLVIGVELAWVPWSEYVNLAHDNMSDATPEDAALANGLYFYGMFVTAALVDFFAVQVLISTLKKNNLYQMILILLFCTSLASHTLGMVAFFMDFEVVMQVYDYVGRGILALEAVVIITYGLDRLLIRDEYSGFNTPKGGS